MFKISKKTVAIADKRLDSALIRNLWRSFCCTLGELDLENGAENTFVIGSTGVPDLKDGKEFAICVDESGAAVVGRDFGGLMRGIAALMMKIDGMHLPCFTQESSYSIEKRMIHICVFPEQDLYYLKKVIRLAGLCQYTHIVIEFWGMLLYECMSELAWKDIAFSKDEVKQLIDEARAFGMEPIPMFNHFGHATQSRVCYGKHVVLDQNPSLQEYFTPDGWAWDINSEKVYTLLKNIRQELYEIFGEGEYFHIGCDEAYYYTGCDELRQTVPDFFKKLTEDIVAEGRRPMMWMDMLIEKNRFKDCYGTCVKGEEERLISSLSKETVMVDWQYSSKEVPVPSTAHLKKTGYDLVGAPWLVDANYSAVADTVKEIDLYGIMLTTWHTLKNQMQGILGCAKKCGAAAFPWSEYSGLREETATLLRRVSFEGNDHISSGWSKYQIEV